MASCDTVSMMTSQPHKLTSKEITYEFNKNVPQWSVMDVGNWFKQIGFSELSNSIRFLENQIDGDLLLRLTEDELRYDLGIHNEVMKKRFVLV